MQPGDLLPTEFDLAASRTVVREAVKVLTAKGLVESRPKTGTRVRVRDAWNLLGPDVLALQQDGADGPTGDALLRKLTEVRAFREMAQTAVAPRRAGFEPFVQAGCGSTSRFCRRAETICSSK